jgi:hypothetical protein
MTIEGSQSAGMWERVMRAVRLDPTLYKEVSADETKTVEAMLVTGLAAALSGLGAIFGPADFKFIGWIIGAVVAATIGLAIGTGILWLIGKLFSGKAQFIEMFRPLGYAYAPQALGIIPWIGGIVGGIWSMVCAVFAVRESEEVSTGSAVAIVLIPLLIGLVILAVFAAAILAAFFGLANSS